MEPPLPTKERIKAIKSTGIIAWVSDRINFKIAVRTGVSASIGLLLGSQFSRLTERPDNLSNGLWCVVSAIVVLQAQIGGTYKAAWNRFFGVTIGALIGAFVTTFLEHSVLNVGLAVAATIMICSIFKLEESLRIACLTLVAIVIPIGMNHSGNNPIEPWLFSLYRFLDSTLGIVIGLFTMHALWPSQAVEKIRSNMAQVLNSLSRLYHLCLSLELREEKHQRKYENLCHETDKLLADSRLLLDEGRVELLTKPAQFDGWSFLTNHLEEIYRDIDSLWHLSSPRLQPIFDDILKLQFTELVEETELALTELSKSLRTKTPVDVLPKLLISNEKLNNELARFRKTHTTRQFNLQEVESFFVLFYVLRTIVEDLRDIEENVRIVND